MRFVWFEIRAFCLYSSLSVCTKSKSKDSTTILRKKTMLPLVVSVVYLQLGVRASAIPMHALHTLYFVTQLVKRQCTYICLLLLLYLYVKVSNLASRDTIII